MTDSILILDFGSQVTQLIARRVRESVVYCEIFPYNTEISRLEDFNANGIILSGGPASVLYDDTPRAPEFVFNSGLPLLGICYGQQTMCAQLGGRVESSAHREFGRAEVKIIEDCEIFSSAKFSFESFISASILPPKTISVPLPAILVAIVTEPGLPA